MFSFRRPMFTVRFFSAVARNMEKERIVPDIIDVAPKQLAEIVYPSGVKVELGNELTPTNVKDVPTVKWSSDKSAFYTLCMIDADAPSRTYALLRQWHHWLVGNIPGCDIPKGDTLSEYIGSGPSEGTGLHRYVFLIYKQGGKLNFNETRLSNWSRLNREKFSINNFALKYNLCNPIAGNFYQAQWDNYVPILYKKLGA